MWPWARRLKSEKRVVHRGAISLFLEALEARCVLAAPITLSPSGFAAVTGDITVPFTRDLYEFTATRTGGMTIRQSANFADGTNLNSYLTIFSEDGERLALSDNDGLSFDSLVQFNVQAGATYRIAAASNSGSVGGYQLRLSTGNLFPDDVGNRFADAVLISPAASRTGNIEVPGDQDMFRFVAPSTGSIVLRQQAANSNLDSFLSVFNSAREQIAFDDDSGDNFHSLLRFNVSAGETYYLRAAAASAGTTGDYVLRFAAATAFSDDHGNALSDAAELDLDSFGLGRHTGNIDVSGDHDMFRFVAPITGGLTLQQGPINGGGLASILTLLDADGVQLAFSDNTDGLSLNSRIHVDVVAGQVYYVQAAAYTSVGAYQLTVVPDVHPAPARETEPASSTGRNDDLVSADTLFGQTDLVGELPAGDMDVFRFTVTDAGSLSTHVDAAFRPRLQVRDQAGRLLFQTDSTASLDAYLQTGTYYLVVSALDAVPDTGYRLQAFLTPGDDPIVSEPLSVGTEPVALAVGDFNQDGQLDLVSANRGSGDLSILLGQSGGDFRPQLAIAVPDVRTVVVADFNRDGRADLVIATINEVQVLLGHGDGTFRARDSIAIAGTTLALVAGNFDQSGGFDLAVLQADRVLMFQGKGDGTFRVGSQVAVDGATAVTAADVNRDGLRDLAVTRDNEVVLLLGTGSGAFKTGATYLVGAGVRGITTGDFNGDRLLDLATVNAASGNVSILLGRGNGLFRATRSFAAGNSPQTLAVGDFNGDGKLDLAVANRFNFVALLIGQGDGAFAPPNGFGAGFDPTAMASGDFNDDGRLDLATTNADGSLSIMLNAAPAGSQPFLQDAADATGVQSRHVPLLGDVNGDRIEDLVILDRTGNLLFRRGLASGGFAPPRIINPDRPARDVTLIDMGASTGIAALQRGSDTAIVYVGNRTTFLASARMDTGLLPVRILAADLNGDDLDDLAIASALDNSLTLAFQTAPGQFSSPGLRSVGNTPSSIVAADLGNPAGLDLLVTGQRGGDITILRNDADNTFGGQYLFRAGSGLYSIEVSPLGTRIRATLDTADCVVADFTGDGLVDVIALNRAASGFSLLAGQGDGSLANAISFASGAEPTQLATGDFNRDGRPDLAILMAEQNEVWVYLNNDGTFAEPMRSFAGIGPAGLTVADDGRLLIGNEFGDVLTLLGDGTGAFAVDREDFQDVPLAVTDLNGDGLADVVLASQSLDKVSVLFREPGSTDFTAPIAVVNATLLAPGAVQLTDLDGDALADLVVASRLGNKVLVYRGLGAGQFAAPIDYQVGFDPVALTIADLNGDVVPDLAVANHGSNDVSILLGALAADGWQATPGPRLNSGGQGPLAVSVLDQNRDRIPDLIVTNAGGQIATLPGIGSGGLGTGFFRDVDPLIISAGAPIEQVAGNVILSALGIQQLNPIALTLTTLFAATNLQALSAEGSLIVAAFDDGHLGLLENGNLISEFNGFLDQPSALEILQNGNNLEVYISQVGREVPVIVTGAEFIALVTETPTAAAVVEGTVPTGPELLLLATLLPGTTTRYARVEEVRSEAVDELFVQLALAQDMIPIVETRQVGFEGNDLPTEPNLAFEMAPPGEAFQLGLDDAFAQRHYWQQIVDVAIPVMEHVIEMLRPLQSWPKPLSLVPRIEAVEQESQQGPESTTGSFGWVLLPGVVVLGQSAQRRDEKGRHQGQAVAIS